MPKLIISRAYKAEIIIIGWFVAANLTKFVSLTSLVIKYNLKAESKAKTLSRKNWFAIQVQKSS